MEVRVVIWENADALTVPTASLFRRQGEWSVFVINGEVLQLRTVKVGQRNEQAAQILEGLSPGERVVAYPGESLSDGAKVRVREVLDIQPLATSGPAAVNHGPVRT